MYSLRKMSICGCCPCCCFGFCFFSFVLLLFVCLFAVQPKLELSNFYCFSLPSTWITDMRRHIWLQVNDIKNKSWAACFSPITTGTKNPKSLFLNVPEEKVNFYNQKKKSDFKTKYIKPPLHKRTVIVKENPQLKINDPRWKARSSEEINAKASNILISIKQEAPNASLKECYKQLLKIVTHDTESCVLIQY